MKFFMRRHFVPNHYYKDLYLKLQSLTQSSKTVDKYHKEMEIEMIWANVVKDKEATTTRFLNGLDRDMVHVATKVERQIKRRGSIRTQIISTSSSA
jgi:hypothetical protein